MTFRVPLLVPDMPSFEELTPWLRQIDQNRWYTNFGPLCREFEAKLRDELQDGGDVYITTTANCTLGLELALGSLDLPRGATVLTPAVTFVATGTAIARAGLDPLLCDVEEDSWLLTPATARRVLSERSYDAVLPVATFGLAQEPSEWDAFVCETGIPVVIDAASAFGNQRVGDEAIVVFSLHATKPLGVGEGGVVACRSRRRAALIRRASNFGVDSSSPYGDVKPGGTNAKLSEYHAAVGLAALPRWREHRRKRVQLYEDYRRLLHEELGSRARFQSGAAGRDHALLPVRIVGQGDAAATVADLQREGVDSRRWYLPPLHRHTAFRNCARAGALTIAETLSRELIGLPFFVEMQRRDVRAVLDALKIVMEARALKWTSPTRDARS